MMVGMLVNDTLGAAAKSVFLAGLRQATTFPNLSCSPARNATLSPCVPRTFRADASARMRSDPFQAKVRSVYPWWASYVAAVLHFWGLGESQRYMQARYPAKIPNTTVFARSIFPALVSIVGALCTLPPLFTYFRTHGLAEYMCNDQDLYRESLGSWSILFACSNCIGLLATALLVLKKRNEPFLYWYHHSSVLLCCWHACMWSVPTGLLIACMNLPVQVVMYAYYAQAAQTKSKPNWGVAVTTLLVLQMVAGVALTGMHLYQSMRYPATCKGYLPNLSGALAMYLFYFGLFAVLFCSRYVHWRKVCPPLLQRMWSGEGDIAAGERLKCA